MMDGYSFYVVYVEERNLLVMDPTETSVHNDEMKLKHEGNAYLVLEGLPPNFLPPATKLF